MDEPTGAGPVAADSVRREEVLAAALTRMHDWPAAGRFVIPRDNTFAAHLALVKSPRGGGLLFSPEEHPCFDGVIAFSARRPDLFAPDAEPMRNNLAVLRNYILGLYYQDAKAYGDNIGANLDDLSEMAGELARGLRNEHRSLPKLLAPRIDSSLLNVRASGCAYAYLYLLGRQRKEGLLADALAFIRRMLGLSARDWGLPPLAETPFGAAAESAPAPSQDVLAMSDEQLDRYCRSLEEEAAREVAKYEQSRQNVPPVESKLNSKIQREVVDHGIIILRWFRNVEFPDKSAMEMLEAGTPAEKAEMVGAVGTFVNYYQQIAARAMERDPGLAQREEVRKAGLAAKILQHTIKLLAALEKPVSMAQTQQISTDQTQQPDRWHEMAGRTVDRLMDTLKGGLEAVVTAFDQQQQDADQQQEEVVEQAVEQANTHSDHGRRKRRKRKHRSGASGKTQNKVDMAIRADDYALGQGVFANRGNSSARQVHEQITLMQSLQVREVAMKDMELVKSLGKTLAQSGQKNPAIQDLDGDGKDDRNQKSGSGGGGAGSLPSLSGLAMAEASLNDKLAPDQQDVASRIIDKRRRDQQNPGGKKL